MLDKAFARFLIILVGSVILGGCGGGGGGGGTTLTGVVALGAPVVGAVITVSDAAGHTTTATSGADGSYSANITGFTAPFFVRAAYGDGPSFLYSVGTATGSQRLNVHAFTDLAVRVAMDSRGETTMETVFGAALTGGPTTVEMAAIAGQIKSVILPALTAVGGFTAAQASAYDLFHGALTADGTGFDAVLDGTVVTPGGAGTYAILVTVYPTGGGLVVSGNFTVATGGAGTVAVTSGSAFTSGVAAPLTAAGSLVRSASPDAEAKGGFEAIVPNTPELAAALEGIQLNMDAFAATVNNYGSSLASSHLFQHMFPQDGSPRFMHQSYDRDIMAAQLAQFLRGKTVTSRGVDQVLAADLAASPPWVKVWTAMTMAGEQWSMMEVYGLDGATWKLYGDQKLWGPNWSELAQCRRENNAGGDTSTYEVRPTVFAYQGHNDTYVDATHDARLTSPITAATFQRGLSAVADLTAVQEAEEDIRANPTGTALVWYKQYWELPSVVPMPESNFLAVGGESCVFTATPAETDEATIRGVSTEFVRPVLAVDGVPLPVSDTNTEHDLALVSPGGVGKRITMTWDDPKTFVVGAVMIGFSYNTLPPTDPGFGNAWDYVAGTRDLVNGVPTNSGYVDVPNGITQGDLDFWLMGTNGEAVAYKHGFSTIP